VAVQLLSNVPQTDIFLFDIVLLINTYDTNHAGISGKYSYSQYLVFEIPNTKQIRSIWKKYLHIKITTYI